MFRFIARRLLETIPVLLIIVSATFFMIRFVPGGPFTAEKAVTPEILRNLEAHYGLNQPLHRQYFDYLGKLAHGDLGPSFKYPNRTVNEIIADKLPVSLELGLLSLGIALALGLTAGIIASIWKNTWLDYSASSLAMIGICVPTFVLGPLLVLFFAIHLGRFNASGWYDWQDRVLPALTLGCVYAAYIARLTRGGMLEVLNQDYIRTARAKGLGVLPVLMHALRNAAIPIATTVGVGIALLIGGVVVTETVFAIPGVGRLVIDAVQRHDYPVIQSVLLISAGVYVLINLLIDLSYRLFDPRIEY